MRKPFAATLGIVVLLVMATAHCTAQVGGSADMAPVNDRPNPYRGATGWAKLPSGRTWGSLNAVAIDRDGSSVWVAERCGGNQGACVQRPDVDPVLELDANGNVLRSFGKGMIAWPHAIYVDASGNVWVVDGMGGNQVLKFSPTGELVLALGTRGGDRQGGYFFQPNAVVVAPSGEIFVSEGHSPNSRARILVFDASGKLLRTFGATGEAPGQFRVPHDLALDSQGRLFVADRGNNRIQIFSQSGQLLDVWYQFSRPSGLWIGTNDDLYVADSESGSTTLAPTRTAWKRGLRIGSARTGEVRFLIPDPNGTCTGSCVAEEIAVDKNGNIYAGEVGPPGDLKRYVRVP